MSAIQRDVVTLVQQQRWAALATVSEGVPLASMVAYAVEPGLGGLLLFLSQMAAHTRHVVASPQASLAVTTPDTGEGDPQLLPRVSLQGRAVEITRADEGFALAAARYVQRFPDALPRFQLGDFLLFRFEIDEARYVGGFARASTFTGDQLRETTRQMGAAGRDA
jgi:putative heme iron utilization protein